MRSITSRPLARASVLGNDATIAHPDGHIERVVATQAENIRQKVIDRAKELAARAGAPIELVTSGNRGDVHLVIHPDGKVVPVTVEDTPASLTVVTPTEVPTNEEEPPVSLPENIPPRPPMPPAAVPPAPVAPPSLAAEPVTITPVAPATSSALVTPDQPVPSAQPIVTQVPTAAPAAAGPGDAPATRRARRTFIDTREPLQVQPTAGWRRVASALGIKVEASPEDIARETARRAVSAQWGQCRRIAVVNGKGGVGKTMTTAMLSAVFARNGGGGVVAWDNNPTRGSLGWRTEAAGHEATVQDVLEQADRLLDPTAPRSLIADFVHHQTDDRYDVLRSNPQLLAIRQQIAQAEFDLLARVMDRHYRLVVFDSGNDESAERWLRMIDWSQQLVVPTIPSPESAESAQLLLEALSERDERSRQLAAQAVVVVTVNERTPGPALNEIVNGFKEDGVEVVVVPFDPALKSGPLRFGRLQPVTQDAWLNVAASAAKHF